MNETRLGDAQTLRVMRCEASLHLRGANSGEPLVFSEAEPQVRRLNGRMEVAIRGNAELRIPSWVPVEILDCGSDVRAENYTGPLVLGRIRGSLSLKRGGSVLIRGEIDGDLRIEHAGTIEGEQVDGSMRIDVAEAVSFRRVVGNAECRAIKHDVRFEDVLGRLRVLGARGKVRVEGAAGELEIEGAAAVEAAAVAGNLKAVDVSGAVRIDRVGGRLVADGVQGRLTAQFVGGHARLRRIAGEVELPEVAGAVQLMGPLPAEGRWNVRSRGAITVEVPARGSIGVNACAPRGRVRLSGVSEQLFRREAGGRVKGNIGSGGLKLSLLTTESDIRFVSADVERSAAARGAQRKSGLGGRLKRPVEALAKDLREDVFGLVGEVARAAERVASEGGKLGGTVAHEVGRGLGEVVRELERTLAERRGKAPREVSDKVRALGRRVSALVERVTDQAHRRLGRTPSGESSPPDASTMDERRDETLVKILRAVRDGKLRPEQADRLISAWAELRRATGDKQGR
jgi:hypothetical protein